MFYGVPVGGLLFIARSLLEPEEAALAVIKVRGAFRVGAFQVHGVCGTAFLGASRTTAEKSRYAAVQIKSNSINEFIASE